MRRSPGIPITGSKRRDSDLRSGDIDLTAALRERERRAPRDPRGRAIPSAGCRGPVRGGGRTRMELGRATRVAPRVKPIPNAPRKRRNARPFNWKLIVPSALACIGLIASITLALTTRRFAIKQIVFEGVPAQRGAVIEESFADKALNHNVLAYVLLHGRALEKQLATAAPDFATARLSARLPNTLIVQIVRREPVAFLTVGNGGLGGMYVLDERGIPIENVRGGHPAGLMKIVAPVPAAGSAITLGQPLPKDTADQVAQAYALINALATHPQLGKAASIEVDKSDNLGLNMPNNLRFKLGQSTQLNMKLGLIAGLLSQCLDVVEAAEYVDLSYPSRVAVLPKSADSANKTRGTAPD